MSTADRNEATTFEQMLDETAQGTVIPISGVALFCEDDRNPDFLVEMRVIAARKVYGRVEFHVMPTAGKGVKWIAKSRGREWLRHPNA